MSADSLPFHDVTAPSERQPRTGLLGCIAALAFAAFACISPPLSLGRTIEARLFPVLTDQSVPAASVTRIDRTLCWDWIRNKTRVPDILNLDVSLDTSDGDTFAPEIYNAGTGVPWHKGGALPAGHYETRLCTTIPAGVSRDISVRLRQTVTYTGFLGLWTLDVPLPSIVAD